MIRAIGRMSVNRAAIARMNTTARANMRRRVVRAAFHIQGVMRQAVGRPGNVMNMAAVERDGAIRSKPGEPPMKQTGFGQRNIVVKFENGGLIGQIGIFENALYMAYLEFGTDTIAPRPWLRPAVHRERARLRAMLEGGAA